MPSVTEKHSVPKTGPIKAKNGVPYDYIVIIDAGSKGSRVFVYNWLNPARALEAGIDLQKQFKVPLIKRFFSEEIERSQVDSDSESDVSDDELDGSSSQKSLVFPRVFTAKKWHRKIWPGLSSFNESPQKVGNHHLSYLLSLASAVVPKSEHRRTPIYLHSTAGMRLLPPNEQEPILENVCQYLESNSDFYMPDCASHVNIIDGNIEGLYGWLAVNYLVGAFDRPEDHQHGKNHTTYGLLDMGGASTQVVFQPNTTEIAEHQNNLYKLTLSSVPVLGASKDDTKTPSYTRPILHESNVYLDSFLGFGMFQAHGRYLKFLLDAHRKANDIPPDAYRFRTPISDPCLPKGYTFTGLVDEHNVDFTGSSNFQECLNSIFPVLANNTYTTGTSSYNGNCQQLGEESKVSSCLLNDLIPSFDFDVNHFIGVLGYWDTINDLLSSQSLPNHDPQTEKYDYSLIYKKTNELCSRQLNELLEMNNMRETKEKIHEEDLAELCFKASWILNFLHVGLGFPRFGIDKIHKGEKFRSLQLVDKLAGSTFSWTLGRAILYANDEYVQAYNNFTRGHDIQEEILQRPGYFFGASPDSYVFGAEADQVPARPMYLEAVAGAKYPHYDYETSYKSAHELKWSIKPHRFFGNIIFAVLIVMALVLMLGKSGRASMAAKARHLMFGVRSRVRRLFGLESGIYVAVEGQESIELGVVKDDEDGDVFQIEDEED